jgi:hypothetical protein
LKDFPRSDKEGARRGYLARRDYNQTAAPCHRPEARLVTVPDPCYLFCAVGPGSPEVFEVKQCGRTAPESPHPLIRCKDEMGV